MTIKDICKRIPDDVRSERLLTTANPIKNAIVSLSDANMVLLVNVWDTFVEPHKVTSTCPICLDNIRTNFRQMHGTLVELEEEFQKLNLL